MKRSLLNWWWSREQSSSACLSSWKIHYELFADTNWRLKRLDHFHHYLHNISGHTFSIPVLCIPRDIVGKLFCLLLLFHYWTVKWTVPVPINSTANTAHHQRDCNESGYHGHYLCQTHQTLKLMHSYITIHSKVHHFSIRNELPLGSHC